MTAWRAVLRDPRNGDELALEGWQGIQVTENFDGASATIDLPGERPELSFIIELVTNVLLYSNKVLAYQLRIMDAEDVFTENGHTVSLNCQSYESVLARRVLFADYETTGAIDQHEIAWHLVAYTQNFEDIGIRKASNWEASTKQQDRIIQRGKTIVEAINEAATVDDGFDWWIDQNLRMHTQTPRILFDTGLDLVWGARVQSVTRSSASDTYDSVVYVTGATNETQLPSGAVFPPPPPALKALATRPLGRWERAYTYGDLITESSVDAKANFHLSDSSKKRAVYRVTLRHGVWDQTIRPGGLFSLRIRSLPRLDFRVRVRIEEISLAIDPHGAELVELGTRAETSEVEISPTPQLAGVTTESFVSVLAESPPGEVVVDITSPTGRSPSIARVRDMDILAALLKNHDERISRTELH